jgi:hypothetical protein
MDQMTWGADGAGGVPFNGRVSLSGCRIIGAGAADDDVALDWATHAHDDDAIAHVVGAEGSGNALDSIGSYHIRPTAWETDGGWTGAHAISASWKQASGAPIPQVPVNADFTVEFWWYKTAPSGTDGRVFMNIEAPTSSRVYLADYRELAPGNWRFMRYLRSANPPATISSASTGNTFVSGWQHWCIERSGNSMRSYVNGVVVGSVVDVSRVTTFGVHDRWGSDDGAALGWRWNDIYVTARALHGGVAFSPGRYPASGSATLTGAGLATRVPTAVSWNAQTGASYGKVKAVYILDAALGWTAVGGSYPTSPITVSGLTLAADSCLRFALEPKSDTIQSETPTLQDVTLTYATPVTSSPYYYRSLVANRQGRF